MPSYLINVYTEAPYPREYTYRETGSNESVVASRDLKNFRKEDKIKGKRINEVRLKIKKI